MNVTHRSLNDLRWIYRRSETEIRNAFHEAGHALMCLSLGVEIDKVTIKPEGRTSGQVLYWPDSRGYGTPDQQAYIALAGRAGEKVASFPSPKDWQRDYRYSGDMERLEEAMPGITAQEIDALTERARRAIQAWPFTFDALVERLLRRGSIDWDGVMNCIPDFEDALKHHWKRFAVVEDTPAPAVSMPPSAPSQPTRQEAIRAVEHALEAIRNGEQLPPRVRNAINRLGSMTGPRNRGVPNRGIPQLEYADAVPLAGMRYSDPVNAVGYEHRALLRSAR